MFSKEERSSITSSSHWSTSLSHTCCFLRPRGFGKTIQSTWPRVCTGPLRIGEISNNRSEQPGVSWTPRLGVSFDFVVSPFFVGAIVFVSPIFGLDAWHNIVGNNQPFVIVSLFLQNLFPMGFIVSFSGLGNFLPILFPVSFLDGCHFLRVFGSVPGFFF